MAEEGNGEAGSIQGFRRAVDRWGGRGGRGGAFERIGEARGWRWPRGSSSVAAAPFGRGREREQRGNRDGGRARGVPGRVRERPGCRGVSRRIEERGNQAGGGQARRRCSPPSCFVRWHGKKTGEGGQVGWAAQVGCTVLGYGWAAR